MSDVFAHLSAEERRRAAHIAESLRELGANDPEGWALREVEEDAPQVARLLFLQRLWLNAHLWEADPADWFAPDPSPPPLAEYENPVQSSYEAVQRILAAGADPQDLQQVARAVCVETLFDVVHAIDEGGDPSAGEGMPGWLLAEVDGVTDETTGRVLEQLSDDVLMLDPALSGADGSED